MRRILLAVLIFVLAGCSYSFVGQNSKIQGGIKSIYIESVNNQTTQPNLQIYLKRDLINVLNLDPRISLATKANADGFLRVSITNYDVEPISYGESGLASRYRCSISVVFDLIGRDGKAVIESQRIDDFEDYSASDSVSATEKARNEISKNVIESIAEKIRDALFVGF